MSELVVSKMISRTIHEVSNYYSPAKYRTLRGRLWEKRRQHQRWLLPVVLVQWARTGGRAGSTSVNSRRDYLDIKL